MSPLIPIPAEQLPTRVEKMPEDKDYRGIIREVALSDKVDKSNHKYLNLSVQIIEPLEWKDRTANINYVALPGKFERLDNDLAGEPIQLNDYEMKREMEHAGQGTGFGRLCQSAKMKGTFEKEDFLGREIHFMIKNEEFPKGSDNWLPKISIFLE